MGLIHDAGEALLCFLYNCRNGTFYTRSGFANGPTNERIRVEFAVLLSDDDPISGSVICVVGHNCRLLEHEQPELGLSLSIAREYDYLVLPMAERKRAGR